MRSISWSDRCRAGGRSRAAFAGGTLAAAAVAGLSPGAAAAASACPPLAVEQPCGPGDSQVQHDGHGCGGHAAGPVSCSFTDVYAKAMEIVLARAEDPGRARFNLAMHNAQRAMCFVDNPTPDELANILERFAALPPAQVFDGGLRFFSVDTVWTGDVTSGPSGRAQRARLTFSFVPDGTNWDGAPSTLHASMLTLFGAVNIDRGYEFIRQAMANWRLHTGIRFQEVADDGATRLTSMTRSPLRGDIRIGGNSLGPDGTGVLAYNYYPTAGGDMLINTDYMHTGSLGSSANNYRRLRNLICHELGHGLGYSHVVPCTQTKIMEPVIFVAQDMLQVDERRGGARNYGDRYSGNNSAANAINFGNLTSPALRSVIERDLSTNSITGHLNSGEDWFRFTTSSPQNVIINVTPTGGSYINGQQEGGCEGATYTVNAAAAGNLSVELRDSTGTIVLQASDSAPAGQPETITINNMPPGTYTLRVSDSGPNNAFNQFVQLYDLVIRVGDSLAPPQAIAGINKRCQAHTNCFFMGNINSRPTEPGATIPANGYAWDLDDDGAFEVVGNPVTSRQYISNGAHNIRLRVTDSNGMQGFDTITVNIFGATTTITGITPTRGWRGQTVPVTITGTNFKNVTSPSMIQFSGFGLTVVGTPTSNPLGTELYVNFRIALNAPGGPQTFAISNSDGYADSGEVEFTVMPTVCRADWNFDSVINSQDISAFIGDWLNSVATSSLLADVNGDGVVNSSDISAFITLWLNGVANGC